MAYKQSKSEIYLHFVWATWQRHPLITPELERALYRCMIQEAQRCGCQVLALNGMPDHVHLCAKVPAKIAPADVMKRVKGVSSAFANDFINHEHLFRWQESYAVYSIWHSQVRKVVAYIENQKQHHADGTTNARFEETDEEVD